MFPTEQECDADFDNGYGEHLTPARDVAASSLYEMLHRMRYNTDCDAERIDWQRYMDDSNMNCSDTAFDRGEWNPTERSLCASRLLAQHWTRTGARRGNLDLRRELEDEVSEAEDYDYFFRERLEEYEQRCGRPNVLRPRNMAPVYLRGLHLNISSHSRPHRVGVDVQFSCSNDAQRKREDPEGEAEHLG